MLKFSWKQLFIFIMMSLVAMSCNDNGSGSDHDHDHDDHVEIEGMELLINDVVVYKEMEGLYYTDGAVSEMSDVIAADTDTYDVEIRFLDHDGDELEHEEHEDEEVSLAFVIYEDDGTGELEMVSNSSIISLAVEDHEEDEDAEDHHLVFELTGLSEGTSNFTISVMHDGHADFTSLPVKVIVSE